MAECKRLAKCVFFSEQMRYMPISANALKEIYCHGDSNSCARYLLASQGIPLPADLFPNDRKRAQEILAGRLPPKK